MPIGQMNLTASMTGKLAMLAMIAGGRQRHGSPPFMPPRKGRSTLTVRRGWPIRGALHNERATLQHIVVRYAFNRQLRRLGCLHCDRCGMTDKEKQEYRKHSKLAAAMSDSDLRRAFLRYDDSDNYGALQAYESEMDHRDCWI
jgi:hypothetical protein